MDENFLDGFQMFFLNHFLIFYYEYTFAYAPKRHIFVRKWGHVNQDSFILVITYVIIIMYFSAKT